MTNQPQREISILRAVALLGQGKPFAALSELNAAQPNPPLDLAAWLLQASLLGHDNIEKAGLLYSRALDRYPQHPMALLRVGVFTYERGDAEVARTLLERSWAAGPSAEAGVYLGRLYAARGDHLRACVFLAQSAAFEPEGGHWRDTAVQEILERWPAVQQQMS